MADSATEYPPISDYALLGDCHAAALVSTGGSVDWCCLPRMDAGSCFARLLDARHGGHFALRPSDDEASAHRCYLDGTLVLETTFRAGAGEARVIDCLTVNRDNPSDPFHELLRVVEGVRGTLEFELELVARFDYGDVRPWRRHHGPGVYSLSGGDDALLVCADFDVEVDGRHDLCARFSVRPGDRLHLSMRYVTPHLVRAAAADPPSPAVLDDRLDGTIAWWRQWSAQASLDSPDGPGAVRSAIALKALANTATGAIAAAPTTSLPEQPGGSMNWDYRYSWIRDAAFTSRALTEIGCTAEADAFRDFVERSAAGTAEDLQIMYGIGGERRLTEVTLDHLAGWRGSSPVNVGNAASGQLQLDVYGELMEMTWRWHERGHAPDDDYWRFLLDLVDAAVKNWREPDKGLWEVRGDPQHFVHSKVMCWVAVDRGIRLAEEGLRQAPLRRWRKARDEIRSAIEKDGYDAKRGVFVRAFGSKAMDAALLLLPVVHFVEHDDERIVRTVDAVREELEVDGLLLRYRRPKGEREGAFLACSFWLVECLARQGREDEAREVFDRTVATGSELGLFSEEFDTDSGEMLGNFPQGLTHLSHIAAAVALGERHGARLVQA